MNDYQKYGEYSSESAGAESAKTALIFLSIGIGVGALLSLLLSPRSGPQVRQAMRGKLDEARRGVSAQSSRVRDQAARIGGQAREKIMPIGRTQ
jgi:gas vesicle protein